MKIDFGIYPICYFAAVVLGLFSSALLLFSPKNKQANRLLGLLLLAITGWVLDAFFRVSNLYAQNAHLYFLPIYYSFAFGPLLWFYVQAITNSSFRFRLRYLLHFIPVFAQALFYWIVVFQSYSAKYYIWFNVHMPYTYRVEYDGTWLSLVIYLILSLLIVRDYQKWLNNNYSDVTRKMLNWLKVCLFLLILICICWLFEAFLRDTKNLYYKYDFSTGLLCLVVYILGAYSYRQSSLQLSYAPHTEVVAIPTAAVTPDDTIMARVALAMQKDKLYLNAELTLAELAKHLNLPGKIVSANINASFGKPFNTYINSFRVEEIKRRLAGIDAEKLTLLGIAYECGFNSKTSFNRIFKEFTGLSPSEYLKR